MIFQFEHVTDRWGKGGKWDPKPVDLVDLKKVLNKWQSVLSEDGWNSLYWGNHDLPRAVSSWGDDGTYRERSAKMLALVLHLMRGTPYIYQGEELGMTNAPFTSIDDYRDGSVDASSTPNRTGSKASRSVMIKLTPPQD